MDKFQILSRVFNYRGRCWLAILGVLGILGGCASIPFDAPKPASYAVSSESTSNTRIGRAITPLVAAHPGRSGFYLLNDGIDALAARLLLSHQAERSIDAQYYLVLNDITGQLFLAALLNAADRGVRVRLLLDDTYTAGYDRFMAVFDAHPNMEIRVFNPFSRGRGRLLSGMTEFRRVNRRMHNKSMTFDNLVTVVGGRNIGAEYFEAREDSNYNDLDVLGVGPVAQDVSTAFDRYWNDPVAVPVNALTDPADTREDINRYRERVPKLIEEARQTPYGAALESTILDALVADGTNLVWSPATVVADPPEKAEPSYDGQHPEQLSSLMGPVVRAAEQELIVVSAYFVPSDRGVELFRELTGRGVRVLILTNSLASNDVVPVHAGYACYRKALLEAGVELWEIRPVAEREGRRQRKLGFSLSGLHTKAFTVDRRYLFIGSFNWDPRSVNINTEMGIYIDSPALTLPTAERFEQHLPDRAYRLRLNEAGDIEWVTRENDREVVYHNEPEASFWKRFTAGFYSLLPIEDQL